LQLPWPEAFKLLEMTYLFEVPMTELHGMVQSGNRGREISTRFNKCWEGLKAFQKHRGVERAGDLTSAAHLADTSLLAENLIMFGFGIG
jgi:hypothetical protein